MERFEFLKNARVVRETETETFYGNENGEFFRITNDVKDLKIIKESENRILLGKDGKAFCMVSKDPIEQVFLGDYSMIPINHTETELEKAREEAIEKVCEQIRAFAKETPEMAFIEKNFIGTPEGDFHTVGCKVSIWLP